MGVKLDGSKRQEGLATRSLIMELGPGSDLLARSGLPVFRFPSATSSSGEFRAILAISGAVGRLSMRPVIVGIGAGDRSGRMLPHGCGGVSGRHVLVAEGYRVSPARAHPAGVKLLLD